MDNTARNIPTADRLLRTDGGAFVCATNARRAAGLDNAQWRALPEADRGRMMRAAADALVAAAERVA